MTPMRTMSLGPFFFPANAASALAPGMAAAAAAAASHMLRSRNARRESLDMRSFYSPACYHAGRHGTVRSPLVVPPQPDALVRVFDGCAGLAVRHDGRPDLPRLPVDHDEGPAARRRPG